MEKIKSFFIKCWNWIKKTSISVWNWLKKTCSSLWKWCMANKVIAGVIAGAAVLAITVAIVVPVSVSAAKGKKAANEPGTQQSEGDGGQNNDNNGQSEHTHTYATEWSTNETNHWHASTCGHDVKGEEGKHTFGDWVVKSELKEEHVCSVCGYKEEKDHVHSFGNWSEDPSDDQHDIRTCSACGKTEQRDHVHSFNSGWSYNGDSHWHSASCSHTSQKSESGYHTINNSDFTVIDHEDTEYTYKYLQCPTCGLYLFRDVELYGEVEDSDGSATDEWVIGWQYPTKTETGWIKYFPNSSWQYESTLVLPKIGDDRFIGGDMFERPYLRYQDGSKFYATLNPNAFTDTTDNEVLARILSAKHFWKFEIDEDSADALKQVDSIYWYTKPDYSHAGQICVEYDDLSYDLIDVNGWGSTSEWVTPADVDSKGSHQDKITYHVLKAGGASLEDSDVYHNDYYVRSIINDILEDELCVWDYDHSEHATYCTLKVLQYSFNSGTGKITIYADVMYGYYQQSHTFYFYNFGTSSIVSDYFSTSKWENSSGATAGSAYADQRSLYLVLAGTYTQSQFEKCFDDIEYDALLCDNSGQLETAYETVYAE